MMSLRNKVLICLVLLILAFTGGIWVGCQIHQSDVDPQDYVQTIFTPYDDGLDSYLAFLDKAHKSVYVAVYAYTDQRITDKLIKLRKSRNIDVHVLLDLSQTAGFSGSHESAQIERLRAAGVEVVIGTSEKSHQIMHHKYTVVDAEWVEDGSWNYTKAADNQANLLNYTKSPKRAKLFLSNWQRMYRFMKGENSSRSPANQRRKRSH